MRLGHFDPVGPLQQFSMDDVCSTYAQALSYDGLVQSAALIKNDANTLPLNPKGTFSLKFPRVVALELNHHRKLRLFFLTCRCRQCCDHRPQRKLVPK